MAPVIHQMHQTRIVIEGSAHSKLFALTSNHDVGHGPFYLFDQAFHGGKMQQENNLRLITLVELLFPTGTHLCRKIDEVVKFNLKMYLGLAWQRILLVLSAAYTTNGKLKKAHLSGVK